MEFSELNVEYGYGYESAAVIRDGTPEPTSRAGAGADRRIRTYDRQPSGFTVARMPGSTTRTATDTRSRTWSLPAGSCSSPARTARAWCEAARSSGRGTGIPLDAVRSVDLTATCMTRASDQGAPTPDQARRGWSRRPDRHIGWRSATARGRPRDALAAALGQILARRSTPLFRRRELAHDTPLSDPGFITRRCWREHPGARAAGVPRHSPSRGPRDDRG